MHTATIITIVVSLSSLSLVNAGSLTNDEELKQIIVSACNNRLKFKQISEFEDFLANFNELLTRETLVTELMAEGASSVLTKRCIVEKEAIFAMAKVMKERERPCKPDNVELLMDLAQFWLVDYKRNPVTNGKRSIINEFFTLYAVELAYQCKRHLLAHLNQADEKVNPLDFVRVLSTPLGWEELMKEHTSKALKFGKSTNGRNDVVNKLSSLIAGLRRIEHMDLIIEEPMPLVATEPVEEEPMKEYEITAQAYNYLKQIIESCQNLEQFYLGNIMSLARLQQLGVVFDMGQIDEHHDASASMHKWLAVTSFCQTFSMVQMEQISYENESQLQSSDPASIVKMKARILKDIRKAKHRQRYYTYVAPIKEIGDFARDKSWLVTMGTRGGLVRNTLETANEMYHGKFTSDGKKKTRVVVQTDFEQYLKALQADLGSPIVLDSDKQVEAQTQATLFGQAAKST